ncbi:MAG: AMP-binding protein [Candidatus Omnitrophica bacterium]|nr:AMP-binding protein [Candidatus Omnitrophota bacterium]
MDVDCILQQSASRFGTKPALIFQGQTISFAELKTKVFQLAHGLEALSVKKGTKVALFLPNSPEYVYSYLACFCRGAIVVPLDFMLKNDELISCLEHSQTEILIACPKAEVDLAQIKKQVPSLKTVIVLGEPQAVNWQRPFDALLGSEEITPASISPTDPCMIMYTSGTTGNPKGILLNYRHLDGSPQAMKYFVDLTEGDVKLCGIPLSHIAGFIYIQNCIIFGITLVLMERFHPLEFLKNVAQYRVTCFHIVPAMYTALLTLKHIDQFDLSSLRWVVVFGAPSSPDVLERFHRYCPHAQLLNGWGMTETCPPNTVTPLNSNRIESVGKPASNCEINIFDNNDQPLPVGEVGEIVIRGWVVMQEYYKDPEVTSWAKRNGWFHTGDLGRFDRQGFLYIVGRKKEMIKVSGQIVYAPEVETVLYQHEAVQEAAVVGVADPLRGELVKAFVVLKPQAELGADELRYFAREHLANFKVPHTIEIRESLPKNRTGKIDKESLRAKTVSEAVTRRQD